MSTSNGADKLNWLFKALIVLTLWWGGFSETLEVLKLDSSAKALVCSNFSKYVSTIMFNCRGFQILSGKSLVLYVSDISLFGHTYKGAIWNMQCCTCSRNCLKALMLLEYHWRLHRMTCVLLLYKLICSGKSKRNGKRQIWTRQYLDPLSLRKCTCLNNLTF